MPYSFLSVDTLVFSLLRLEYSRQVGVTVHFIPLLPVSVRKLVSFH